MDMGTGFKVSLIAAAVEMLVLFSILIPFFR